MYEISEDYRMSTQVGTQFNICRNNLNSEKFIDI